MDLAWNLGSNWAVSDRGASGQDGRGRRVKPGGARVGDSDFVYLHGTLVEGVPDAEALATMNAVWDPADQQQWADLIKRVTAEYAAGGWPSGIRASFL